MFRPEHPELVLQFMHDVSLASQMILICQYYLCCAVFYGLCETLFKLDQGLVCSSSCNIETMKIGTLQCYYLLLPSEKGPMLLRVQATLLVPYLVVVSIKAYRIGF